MLAPEAPVKQIAKEVISEVFTQSEPAPKKLTKEERRERDLELKRKEIAEANLQRYNAKNR